MAVSITEALEIILDHTRRQKSEIIPIEQTLTRIASKEVISSVALPPFNNSAMDGFGLKGNSETYNIVGKILAGEDKEFLLQNGECIAIMTGAKVPNDVEAVIPQENTTQDGDLLNICKPVNIGANIRQKGEDIKEGAVVLSCGEKIDASHVGLLASQGITHIEVFKRPKVAVFAGGSELRLHFETLSGSQIYNSNTPYFIARAAELGCDTTFVGKAKDDIDSLKDLILASLDADLIITSGGVSVGEADFTKEAFGALGMESLFSKIEIKPGKPTTFGRIGDTLVLSLPGNPLAGALNFELFGKPLIAKMSGLSSHHHSFIETKISSCFKHNKPIDTIIPGYFDGTTFKIAEKYAPGMVNVLNRCNGYIVVSAKTPEIQKGDLVRFLPMKWGFQREEFVEIYS